MLSVFITPCTKPTRPHSTIRCAVRRATRSYQRTIAWATPYTPLDKEINPRAAFDRLFGADVLLSPEERAEYDEARAKYRDFVRSRGIDMRRPDGWSQFIIQSQV